MKMIEVNNLSKEYQLGGKRRANTIRDLVTGAFRLADDKKRMIKAVDGITFTVESGETVGIIGNNGAGKSTLLKILSRIVVPTSGEVLLYGRTGSLLEVGTGFHRELSGRDNIYLNGAILGMKRAEIEERFEEIVEFAEVSEFLDTPIKHYSSGMFMRLAFSVAAHLEPEILIVDEVLAVGDLAFQRKCMDKMQEVNQKGRTILFVSHNMQAVTRVCQRALWIDDGVIRADGNSEKVVSEYLEAMLKKGSVKKWSPEEAPGDEVAKLLSVEVLKDEKPTDSVISVTKPFEICLEIETETGASDVVPSIEIVNELGITVFTTHPTGTSIRTRGCHKALVRIPANLLAEGNYFVSVSARTTHPYNLHFDVRDVTAFLISDPMSGESARGHYGGEMPGVVRPILEWELSEEE